MLIKHDSKMHAFPLSDVTWWNHIFSSWIVISQRRVVDVCKHTVNEQSRVAVHTLQYCKVLRLYFDGSPNIAFPEDSFSIRYLCLSLPRLLEVPLSLSCCEDIQYNSISLLFGIAHCGDLKKYLSFLGCHHLTSKCAKNVFIAVLQHMPFFKSPEIPPELSEWPWLKVALEKEFYRVLDTFIITLMSNKHLDLYLFLSYPCQSFAERVFTAE